MKKKLLYCAAIIAFSFIYSIGFSQNNTDDNKFTQHKIPTWASDKGYWIVEDNVHQPLSHIVRFYTNENTMTGSITVTGSKLNIKKKKVKMQLKAMMESSVHDWAMQHPETTIEYLAKKP